MDTTGSEDGFGAYRRFRARDRWIQAGPVKQELKIDVPAGSYFFQCDVHPTTMKGALNVS